MNGNASYLVRFHVDLVLYVLLDLRKELRRCKVRSSRIRRSQLGVFFYHRILNKRMTILHLRTSLFPYNKVNQT